MKELRDWLGRAIRNSEDNYLNKDLDDCERTNSQLLSELRFLQTRAITLREVQHQLDLIAANKQDKNL